MGDQVRPPPLLRSLSAVSHNLASTPKLAEDLAAGPAGPLAFCLGMVCIQNLRAHECHAQIIELGKL